MITNWIPLNKHTIKFIERKKSLSSEEVLGLSSYGRMSIGRIVWNENRNRYDCNSTYGGGIINCIVFIKIKDLTLLPIKSYQEISNEFIKENMENSQSDTYSILNELKIRFENDIKHAFLIDENQCFLLTIILNENSSEIKSKLYDYLESVNNNLNKKIEFDFVDEIFLSDIIGNKII